MMIKTSLILALYVTVLLPVQAYAHVEEGEEAEELLILSRYVKSDVELIIDPESEQWEQSFENDVESIWGHEIFVKALNNGTHVFFLLSWFDPTRAAEGMVTEADGAALIFEIVI
jgi:hypothetical protein